MTHAIRIYKTGNSEVMIWERIDVGRPSKGELRIRQTAVGLNYIDVYHRSGLYPVPLPTVLGLEGVGVVDEIGENVTGIRIGDRVAYASPPLGAYAEARILPADRVLVLPESISDVQAAGMMLKGLTAQYLLRRTFQVSRGDFVLVHAAAGGVGLILCQWARYLGAAVIGTVSNEEKAALAAAHGCNYPIISQREDFVSRVKEITSGGGVSVVYDSIGRDTFVKSLSCLKPMGTMVLFGQSSGSVEPVDLTLLAANSLYLTRPSLMAYMAKRSDLERSAKELFTVVSEGQIKVTVGQTYPLGEAARAHKDLEGRRTVGSTVLIV